MIHIKKKSLKKDTILIKCTALPHPGLETGLPWSGCSRAWRRGAGSFGGDHRDSGLLPPPPLWVRILCWTQWTLAQGHGAYHWPNLGLSPQGSAPGAVLLITPVSRSVSCPRGGQAPGEGLWSLAAARSAWVFFQLLPLQPPDPGAKQASSIFCWV